MKDRCKTSHIALSVTPFPLETRTGALTPRKKSHFPQIGFAVRDRSVRGRHQSRFVSLRGLGPGTFDVSDPRERGRVLTIKVCNLVECLGIVSQQWTRRLDTRAPRLMERVRSEGGQGRACPHRDIRLYVADRQTYTLSATRFVLHNIVNTYFKYIVNNAAQEKEEGHCLLHLEVMTSHKPQFHYFSV